MNQIQECMDSFDALEAPYVSIIVDRIMEQDFPRAPAGALIPEGVWLKQKREELSAMISGRNLQLRFRRAFELIENDSRGYATPVEMHRMSQEFREGVRRLIKALSEIPSDKEQEAAPMAFAEILGLSDETIEFIYQCGNRHYQANEMADAADIFHLLACLDFRRHNVWVAQGAAEQTLGHFEAAIKAYAMAMLANPNAPLPYVHSAECYLALSSRISDAQECLDAALKCVSEQHDDSAGLIRQLVEEIRSKIN
jgi:tetratricopeptide (TPR) repeat protein